MFVPLWHMRSERNYPIMVSESGQLRYRTALMYCNVWTQETLNKVTDSYSCTVCTVYIICLIYIPRTLVKLARVLKESKKQEYSPDIFKS